MTHTVLVDCRWLPIGGAGRLTELLLRGFREVPPEGRWVLWGPPRVRELAWDGAEVVVDGSDPRALNGQARALGMPSCDFALFLHQQRPLRPVPSATMVLDTIPLRHASGPFDRAAKLVFLKLVVRLSREVLTVSEYAKGTICRDLGARPEDVTVVRMPYDDGLVAAVSALRPVVEPLDAALYVGSFLAHKNLRRLVDGFAASAFAASGGRLILVGGPRALAEELAASLPPEGRAAIEVRTGCDDAELRRLYAAALLLVQPSLEEGFGLPVVEALACGLPACVSDGGALPLVTRGRASVFRAESVESITATLDECAAEARQARASGRPPTPLTPAELGLVPVAEFAHQFEAAARRHTRQPGRR